MATLELVTRRAPVTPETLDIEARTFRVTWTTFADVRRGSYIERLEPAGCDLARLIGAPVLDSHRRGSLADQIGVVVDAGITGEGWAIVKISERRDDVLKDIAAGIVRSVSVGFSVELWRDGGRAPDGTPIRVAANWTPIEISLVPLPADPGAQVRQGVVMDSHTVEADPAAANRATLNEEIRSIGKIAGLSREAVDDMIDRSVTADEARKVAFEALAKRDASTVTSNVQIVRSYDDPALRARWIGEALHARNHPDHQLSEPARQYAGYGIADTAREILRSHGERVTGLASATLIERAMSTSDLPITLGEVVDKAAQAGYTHAAPALLSLAGLKVVPDFNEYPVVQMGEAGTLQRKREGGEIKYSSLDERVEKVRVVTWGEGLKMTREALINDRLGLLSDGGAVLGRAARETEAQEAVTQLTANSGAGPVLADSIALFASGHANLAGSGATISDTTLSAARLAMRKQTDAKDNRIGITPTTLLVPPDLETVAERELSAVQAATVDNVNVFSSLRLLVESRLTNATRWYLAGTGAPGMVIVRLEGRAGPQVESMVDFDTKSIKFSVLNDFAIDWLDWRAWYSNPGA